jgi:hypothetical protein
VTSLCDEISKCSLSKNKEILNTPSEYAEIKKITNQEIVPDEK